MSRADKVAARRVLAGKPARPRDLVTGVRDRSLAIARRYVRFLAHLRRGRLH